MAKKEFKRDNFNSETIKKIKGMAGDVCSMPGCRVITGGAKLLHDNTFSIGVAAHMCAASPGGPRYDPSMTKEQRKNYENGIWLCQTHARMIDVDPSRFPVDMLRAWKDEAEKWSMSSVGQKLITQIEHDKAIRVAVGRSITEYLGKGESINAPIQDVFLGYEDGLNELDSRFLVKAARRSDGILEHYISSRPGEQGKVNITFKSASINPGVKESILRMIEGGEKVRFERDEFEFSGSKLFEKISTKEGGELYIGGNNKPVELVIYLRMKNGEKEEFANFKSKLISGTKYGKITGEAFSGLLSVNFVFSICDECPKLNITLNSKLWVGQDVNRLGYFSSIKRIVKHLRGDDVSGVAVEVIKNNQTYRIGTGNLENKTLFINAMIWHVDILSAARIVSNVLLKPLIVKNFNMSVEDEETLLRCAALLEGDLVEVVEAGHEFCQGEFSPDGFDGFDEALHKKSVPSVHFVEDEGRFFNVLGNKIKPPPVDVYIEPCEVNRFSYINGEKRGKNGFVIYAIDSTKYSISLHKDRQWEMDSNK